MMNILRLNPTFSINYLLSCPATQLKTSFTLRSRKISQDFGDGSGPQKCIYLSDFAVRLRVEELSTLVFRRFECHSE